MTVSTLWHRRDSRRYFLARYGTVGRRTRFAPAGDGIHIPAGWLKRGTVACVFVPQTKGPSLPSVRCRRLFESGGGKDSGDARRIYQHGVRMAFAGRGTGAKHPFCGPHDGEGGKTHQTRASLAGAGARSAGSPSSEGRGPAAGTGPQFSPLPLRLPRCGDGPLLYRKKKGPQGAPSARNTTGVTGPGKHASPVC